MRQLGNLRRLSKDIYYIIGFKNKSCTGVFQDFSVSLDGHHGETIQASQIDFFQWISGKQLITTCFYGHDFNIRHHVSQGNWIGFILFPENTIVIVPDIGNGLVNILFGDQLLFQDQFKEVNGSFKFLGDHLVGSHVIKIFNIGNIFGPDNDVCVLIHVADFLDDPQCCNGFADADHHNFGRIGISFHKDRPVHGISVNYRFTFQLSSSYISRIKNDRNVRHFHMPGHTREILWTGILSDQNDVVLHGRHFYFLKREQSP